MIHWPSRIVRRLDEAYPSVVVAHPDPLFVLDLDQHWSAWRAAHPDSDPPFDAWIADLIGAGARVTLVMDQPVGVDV